MALGEGREKEDGQQEGQRTYAPLRATPHTFFAITITWSEDSKTARSCCSTSIVMDESNDQEGRNGSPEGTIELLECIELEVKQERIDE